MSTENVLTGLIPTIREALHTVSREMVGHIPAVWKNPQGKMLERASVGQNITFPITPKAVLEDGVAGQLPADSGNQTITPATITITRDKVAPVLWNGEQSNSLQRGDRGTFDPILRDQFAQGFRSITNLVESDVASLYTKLSRSSGTAGTLPFATAGDLSDFAESLKILKKNGSPQDDLHMVLGHESAGSLLSKQATLFQVNTSGTNTMLRQGELGMVQKFAIGESGQIDGHTKGTGTLYTSTAAGFSIGTTEIPLITGSGTILAGDTITFAGDPNKYIVVNGVAAPGTITIGKPGLIQAIPAAATALTIGATSTEQNMFFDRHAIVLITRPPKLPAQGDAAMDRTMVVDPISGLAFEISAYKQYRQVKFEIALVWGFDVVNEEHAGILLS